MRPSKNLHLSAIITALIAITGCTKPQTADDGALGPGRHGRASANATFIVSKCNGKGGTKDILRNPDWKIPTHAQLRMSACLRDRSTGKDAEGHKFEIEDAETGQRYLPIGNEGASGPGGCISWEETPAYPFFAKQSAPYQVVRRIHGVGIHSGYYELRYSVNPWALGDMARDKGDGNPGVLCLEGDEAVPPARMISEPKAKATLLSGEKENMAELFIRDISIKTVGRKSFREGEQIEMYLELHPKIERLRADGTNDSDNDLNTGKFEIFAHLIGTEGGGKEDRKIVLTTSEMSRVAVVRDKVLLTTLKTDLVRALPKGNISLVIRVKPVGLPGRNEIATYEGVFELGPQSELAGGAKAVLTQSCIDREADCNLFSLLEDAANYEALDIASKNPVDAAKRATAEFIQQQGVVKAKLDRLGFSTFGDLKQAGYALNHEALSFQKLRLRFVSLSSQPPETATQRTVAYSAETCIAERRSGAKVANMPFQIDYLDDSGNPIPTEHQTKSTHSDGCLRWTAYVRHKYYMPEQFIPKRVRITMGETTAGTVISFVLNPWDWGFTFGFDLDEVGEDYLKEIASRKKIRSRFFTHGYGYHTIRFLYSFNKYLELEVKKTVLLEVEPRVLRYSAIADGRKRTEALRDGVYLMKVAFQKNYLDPATARIGIVQARNRNRSDSQLEPESRNPDGTPNPKYLEVEKNEYISTFTSLVRVVDGRLIKPVELTMHDLRLMRIRSNFLIQLEPIDERLIKAEDAFKERYRIDLKEIRDAREKFKVEQEKLDQDPQAKGLAYEEYLGMLRERASELRSRLRRAFTAIREVLSAQTNPYNDLRIPRNLLEPLADALKTNDFTDLQLPNCDKRDCNEFRENPPDYSELDIMNEANRTPEDDVKRHGSGLMARTFVGPVIYLSNGYSDAVRATDNLDEACINVPDPNLNEKQKRRRSNELRQQDAAFYRSGGIEDEFASEDALFDKGEAEAKDQRQNLAYRYSKYYGSLSHLCYIDVDELIEAEIEQKRRYAENMAQIATIENFAGNANADFAILNSENQKEVTGRNENILTTTQLRDFIVQNPMIQPYQPIGAFELPGSAKWLAQRDQKRAAREFKSENLTSLFFNSREFEIPPVMAEAVCRVLTNRSIAQLRPKLEKQFEKRYETSHKDKAISQLAGSIYQDCVSQSQLKKNEHFATCLKAESEKVVPIYANCWTQPVEKEGSIFLDEKLRVIETGDRYTYEGGLQMNLNVGDSFSVARSDSRSRGFEFADALTGTVALGGAGLGWMMGGPAGALLGGAVGGTMNLVVHSLKTVSLKAGDSFSNSDGTSVSASTYLVTQIAKFDINLQRYERCRIFRFTRSFIDNVKSTFGFLEGMHSDINQEMWRGLFVCEGKVNDPKVETRNVKEAYFYFTQHFTEGDMLDQADLLNNPWLLSMRGDRDFGSFLALVKSQEEVSLRNYSYGFSSPGSPPPQRKVDWPLEQLAISYRQRNYSHTTPSFPGFYTILKSPERIVDYPLGKRFINIDEDINGELCRRPGDINGCSELKHTPPGSGVKLDPNIGSNSPAPIDRSRRDDRR